MSKLNIVVLVLIVILFSFLFFMIGFSEPLSLEKIGEEAIPIREDDTIIGMDYVITIYSYVNDNSIVISSHILDSVLHYKDPSSIHDFYIQLSIHNQSKHDYLLKNIRIKDNRSNVIIEELSYEEESNHVFKIFLPEDFFNHYYPTYKMQIELEK